MQQEVDRQNDEIEKLREALGKDEVGKLDIPKPKERYFPALMFSTGLPTNIKNVPYTLHEAFIY